MDKSDRTCQIWGSLRPGDFSSEESKGFDEYSGLDC